MTENTVDCSTSGEMLRCPIKQCFERFRTVRRTRAHVTASHRLVTEVDDDNWPLVSIEKFGWRDAIDNEISEASGIIRHKEKKNKKTSDEVSPPQEILEDTVEIAPEIRKSMNPKKVTGKKIRKGGAPTASAVNACVPGTIISSQERLPLRHTIKQFKEYTKRLGHKNRSSCYRVSVSEGVRDLGSSTIISGETAMASLSDTNPCEDDLELSDEDNTIQIASNPSSAKYFQTAAGKVYKRTTQKRPSSTIIQGDVDIPLGFTFSDMVVMITAMQRRCVRPFIASEVVKELRMVFPSHDVKEIQLLTQMCILSLKLALDLSNEDLARQKTRFTGHDAPAVAFSHRIIQDIHRSVATMEDIFKGMQINPLEAQEDTGSAETTKDREPGVKKN
jgi:hypothetical protein